MASSKLDIVIQAQDHASKVLASIGRQTTDLQKSVSDLGDANQQTDTKVQGMTTAFFKAGLALEAVRMAANAVGSAISKAFEVGKDVLASASAYEQSAIAFRVMLGDATKARTLLRDISKFAKETPFALEDVVEGSKRLLAYNIEAEKIIPTMTALGNVVAGVGKDKMPQLILAYGQVRAATRLTGMELRQFTEAGVPMLTILADQFGVTEARIQEMVSEGVIGFDAVEKAFMGMSQEGGKFYNLMADQSRTYDGTISNLRDNFMGMGREIIGISEDGTIREGSIFQILTIKAQELLGWVEANRANIERFGRQLMDSLVALFNQHVLPALQRFADWLTNPKYASERERWIHNMAQFAQNLGTVAYQGGVVIGWIANAIGWFDKLYTRIKPVTDLLAKIVSFSPPVLVTNLLTGNLPGLDKFKDAARQLKIPGFANGTGFAPGGLAVVGERGPELVNLPRGSQVIPNHHLSSAGGVTINGLTINNYTPNTNASIMADLGWELSRRLA